MLFGVQLASLLLLPFLFSFTSRRWKLQGWLSPVVLCYLAGIAIGNFDLLGSYTGSDGYSGVNTEVMGATVALAIPLLLISTNIPAWFKQARTTTLSFGIAIVAVILSAIITFLLFPGKQESGWVVSGMLTGALTGTTLNMNAVGFAIDAPEETIALVNLADIINGSIYLIFLTSIAQKVLLRFLPSYTVRTRAETMRARKNSQGLVGADLMSAQVPVEASGSGHQGQLTGGKRSYAGKAWIYLRALLLAGVMVGASLLLTNNVLQIDNDMVLVLLLTMFSITGSFRKQLRELAGAYELGQYMLLVFCIAIGMEADFRQALSASPEVFAYAGVMFFLAILFHFIGARFAKIDADTTLITSTAAIYGPPFIPQVAMALSNREVVFSGIITALAGYAVGNFLGIGVAYLLKALVSA